MDAVARKTRVRDRTASASDARSTDRPWQPVFFQEGGVCGRQGRCYACYGKIRWVQRQQHSRFEGERREKAGGEHGVFAARGSVEVALLGRSRAPLLVIETAMVVA